jgi:phospholipid/cholesterol/gamma-HCH transport system ATP-binding protein
MTEPAFLELRSVHKSFRGKPVLCGLSLRVERGQCFTLLGGSGSGKSVSLRHLIGLLQPDHGQVWVDGRDVTQLSERDWVGLRTRIGFVFQGAALFDSLSVKENLAWPLREHRDWDEARISARVAECLEAVGLPGVEALMPVELSGGMRKRVGVARAIALAPEAILYDEPTTGLDPANSRRIGIMIRDLQRRLGVTSVVVTHDLALCDAVSDRVGVISQGVLVFEGTVAELHACSHEEVVSFLAKDQPGAAANVAAQA